MGKASAPDPGRVERMQEVGAIESPFEVEDDEKAEAAPHVLKITIGGKTLALDFDEDLGPGDDTYSRAHIGVALSAAMGLGALSMGTDVLLMLWCVARRKHGEPNLTYERVVAEFPNNAALRDADPSAAWLTDDEVAGNPE